MGSFREYVNTDEAQEKYYENLEDIILEATSMEMRIKIARTFADKNDNTDLTDKDFKLVAKEIMNLHKKFASKGISLIITSGKKK